MRTSGRASLLITFPSRRSGGMVLPNVRAASAPGLGLRRLRWPAALSAVPSRRFGLLEHLLALLLAQLRHPARLHEDAVVDDRILQLQCLEKPHERDRVRPYVRGQVADLRDAVAHRAQRELVVVDTRHLVPTQRSRRARLGYRADGICRRDRTIERVLSVVDEHAGAVLHHPG